MNGTALPRTRLALLLAVWLAGGLPAWAQSSDPSPPAGETPPASAAAEEPTEEVGEEIFVTARKREENIQEVPVAVTVVSAEALEDSGARDLSDLQSAVPNLSIYSGRNQSTTLTVFMRGVGQADPLWGVDPGVGLYLDDVYVARPQGALLDVYDVARVEALRGPQGTLYGKNTIGGALKFVSTPLGTEPVGRISVTGGEFSTQEVRALFGGATADGTLRAKAAVASLQRDGYGTNLRTGRDVSDKDTLAYRLAFEWVPGDAFKAHLSYDHTDDDAEPKGITRLQANPLCPVFSGGPCPPEANPFDTRSGLAPVNSTDSSGYALTLTWQLSSAWQMKSISAYRENDTENSIDFDTSPGRIVDVFATYFDDQTSEELQWIYDGGGALSGVLGLFYFDGRAGGRVQNIFINGLPNPGSTIPNFGTTDGHVDTESIAAFLDGSWEMTDRWTLNLGVRGTREEKTVDAFNAAYTSDAFATVHTVLANMEDSKTFTSVAPKLGVDLQINDAAMTYLSLSRGFKSGGFNIRANTLLNPDSAKPFDDEVLDMAELGVKSVLADRQLVLNGALFYGEYSDVQVSAFTAYDTNGDGVEDTFFGNFVNAGDAEIKGAELEYDWSPAAVEWLGLAGQVSYLDAKPTRFLNENACRSPGVPRNCDNFVDTQVITNAPEWTASLRANVDFPLFSGLLTGSVAWSYRDDAVLTNEGGSFAGRALLPISQEAYELWDAWLSWLSPGGTWRLNVTGRNLADEQYLTNGYNIPALGILQGAQGAPRTVTGTIEFRFF